MSMMKLDDSKAEPGSTAAKSDEGRVETRRLNVCFSTSTG
jgi:hypothetical protein